MTRLRAQPMPEPAAVRSTAASAHRFRSLRRWLELCELGLSDDRIGELLRCGDLPELERELDRAGLGDRARAHIAHLEQAQAPWPSRWRLSM